MIKSINHTIAIASVLLSFVLSSNSHSAEQSAGVARQPAPPGKYQPAAPRKIDPSTLHGKLIFGYQGWFSTADDGGPLDNWNHWSADRKRPNETNARVQMWPDLSEYEADELYDTDLKYPDGSVAKVYSAWNLKTVMRHFRWMRDYNLDGAHAISVHQPHIQRPGIPRLLQPGARQHPPVRRGVWPRVRRAIRHLGLPRAVRREGHPERLEVAG